MILVGCVLFFIHYNITKQIILLYFTFNRLQSGKGKVFGMEKIQLGPLYCAIN